MGRFSFYLLVPRHTSAYSLLANGMLMCRFGPPLAFNFMAAIAMPASKHDSNGDVTQTVRPKGPCVKGKLRRNLLEEMHVERYQCLDVSIKLST